MKNKYRLLLAAGFVGSLTLAGTAFAQTTPASTKASSGSGKPGFSVSHAGAMHNGVFGTVASISGNTLTVTSTGRVWPGGPLKPVVSATPSPTPTPTVTTYTVDATNAKVTKNGAASTLSAVAVGDMVMVQGTVSGSSVTATAINDGMGGMMRGQNPGILGTVASINGDTLTVTSKMGHGPGTSTSATTTTTYTVNATNATVTKNNAASTLSAIAVGDTVVVQGTVSGTSVTATAIRDGVVPGIGPKPTPVIQGNGEPVIAGTITAINGDTLTVSNKSNVTYTVDATNATISVKNAKSTLSSVAVGDSVVVQGTVSGTAVTASSVLDQGTPKTATSTNGTSSSSKGMGSFLGSIGGFFKKIFGF